MIFVKFIKIDMYKMLLATAISVHKSQGNQAKCVIVVIDKSHGFFLNRNIEYEITSKAERTDQFPKFGNVIATYLATRRIS